MLNTYLKTIVYELCVDKIFEKITWNFIMPSMDDKNSALIMRKLNTMFAPGYLSSLGIILDPNVQQLPNGNLVINYRIQKPIKYLTVDIKIPK